MNALDNLRKIRKSKGITLKALGLLVNLSATYLSQIERGKANPSINTLQSIAKALGINIKDFLVTDGNSSSMNSTLHKGTAKIVRKNERKTLLYPGGIRQAQLLTPNFRGELEVIITDEKPSNNNENLNSHEGEEFGMVLEGSYEVTVGDNIYHLEEGDAISYSSEIQHKMRNPGEKNCKVLWVITPPSI